MDKPRKPIKDDEQSVDPDEVLRRTLEAPPKPHHDKNRPKGMRANDGTPETDADPHNPNR